MKILVAFKRVIDPDARIKLKADKSAIDTGSVEYKANPFCENALEEAIKVAEDHDAEVVIVTIGGDDTEQQIRAGLAMGAARAIRVDVDDAKLDSDLAARIIAAVAKKESPDLLFFGKQAVDGDNNQVGQLVAEYLGLPQACFASKVELKDGEAIVTREVDGGLETIAVKLPAVVTADLRLNTPRNAALPMVMKARSKPLAVRPVAEFGVDVTPRLKVEKVSPPAERPGGRTVASVSELTSAIKSELSELEAR